MFNLNLISKYSKELINFFGPFSAIVLNLIFTPLLLMQFGILEWSLFLLIGAIQPLSYLFSLGIPQIIFEKFPQLITHHGRTKKNINEFLQLEIIHLVGSSVFFLFVFFILKIFLNAESIPNININTTVIIISLILLLRMLEYFYIIILNSVQKFYISNISQVISSTIKWIFGYLGVIYLNWELNQFLMFQLLISIIYILFLFLTIRVKFKFSNNYLDLKNNHFFHVSKLQVSFFSIFFFICLTQFDKFIVLIWHNNLAFFAKYSLVLTISSCIPIFTQPLVTLYSSIVNNNLKRNLDLLLLDILNNLFTFILPISIFLFFNLETILTIWLKQIFFDYEIILSGKIFIIGFTFVSIISLFLNYFITIKKQFYFAAIGGLMFLIFIFSSYFSLTKQEIVIFSITWSFINFIFLIILIESIFKNFDQEVKIDYLKYIPKLIFNILILILFFYFLNFMILNLQFDYTQTLVLNLCLFFMLFFILIKYNYKKI